MRNLPNVYISVFDKGGAGGPAPSPTHNPTGDEVWFFVIP